MASGHSALNDIRSENITAKRLMNKVKFNQLILSRFTIFVKYILAMSSLKLSVTFFFSLNLLLVVKDVKIYSCSFVHYFSQ